MFKNLGYVASSKSILEATDAFGSMLLLLLDETTTMRSAETVLIRAMTIIAPYRLKGFECCQCKILAFALCEFFPVICFVL